MFRSYMLLQDILPSAMAAARDEDLAYIADLLWNMYCDKRILPDVQQLLLQIAMNEPAKNLDGTFSLIHLFTTLSSEFDALRKTAACTKGYVSKHMQQYFSDDGIVVHCPMKSLIDYVIGGNVKLTHSEIISLMDYLHGCFLYDDIPVARVDVVESAVYYLDVYCWTAKLSLMFNKPATALRQERWSCAACADIDNILMTIYDVFFTLKASKKLPRNDADQAMIDGHLQNIRRRMLL